MNQGDSPEDIEVHRMIIPALRHHLKSHGPDIINFGDGIPYVDSLIRRMGSDFETFETKGKKIVKRKIDPKVKRIVSHIKKKINTKKGN
jgi:hypothetical protein